MTLEAAGASPVEIVSDIGSKWHVVPFEQPGRPAEPAFIYAKVTGDQITSAVE